MGVHREAELVLGLDQAHALAAHVKKGFQHQSEAKLNSSFSHDKTGVDKAKSSTSPNSRAAVDYRWSGSFRERPRASDSQKEFQETIRRLGHVEVRPVNVVEVADLPLLPSYLVSEGESSTNVVAPVLAKEQCVSHLLWPVLGRLLLVHLEAVAQHHDCVRVLLSHHQPEVVHRAVKWSLCQNVFSISSSHLH